MYMCMSHAHMYMYMCKCVHCRSSLPHSLPPPLPEAFIEVHPRSRGREVVKGLIGVTIGFFVTHKLVWIPILTSYRGGEREEVHT